MLLKIFLPLGGSGSPPTTWFLPKLTSQTAYRWFIRFSQWRRQAWGTGARAPLEFDARKILQPFFVSTYRPITHIKALIAVTVAGCCKKTVVIFVFADLTPDGFHFWMTLSPRASQPVRHASVPPPLEQNSGDATGF